MSEPRRRGDGTRVVHAGFPDAAQGEPFLPGPTFAAPFHSTGDPHAVPYSYGREHNPTWTHFEAALGELEGGPATVFPSGMAAATAVLLPALRPGDVLIARGVGAYQQSQSTQFGDLRPAVVAREGDDWRLVARSESIEDVIAGDLVPTAVAAGASPEEETP